MTNGSCIFCKIIKGEIPAHKVYEDEKVLAFLDINPVNPGHTLVIPKDHYETVYDMPDETLKDIAPLLKKISLAVKQGTNAEGINIIMNNEKSAGQLVPHAHFHVIPRFSSDGHKHWEQTSCEDGKAEKIAEKIRKCC